MATVLVTGSAGRIGRAVVAELKSRGHVVRGLDLVPTPDADVSFVGDVGAAEPVGEAARGTDAVIHLAAIPDDDDFLTKLLPANIVGGYHVLEATRLGGAKRFLFASSGQVTWWQRFTGPFPIGPDALPSPRGWYAAGKLFLEGAARGYSETYGLSVVIARLGWVPRDRAHCDELARTAWGPDVYLSPADAGRFFACAVEAPPGPRFLITYPCSRPHGPPVYDPRPAEALGYRPRHTWPEGVEEMLGPHR